MRTRLSRGAAEVAKTGDYKNAANIVGVFSKPIPRPLLYSMRFLGMAGPLFSTYFSAASIYEGASDSEISEEQKTHKVVSGSMGVASSLFFLGGAFFVTPASLPIGISFYLIGSSVLVAQTIYDEWDSLLPRAEQMAAAANPFPALYEAHLRKAQVASATGQKG